MTNVQHVTASLRVNQRQPVPRQLSSSTCSEPSCFQDKCHRLCTGRRTEFTSSN